MNMQNLRDESFLLSDTEKDINHTACVFDIRIAISTPNKL